MINKKTKAFTVVELIVVITILAILGTIAFISLQGYSKSARNSRRISDGKSIEKTLELFKVQRAYYPEPSDFQTVIIDNSGIVQLWKQGNFGDEVFRNVEKLSKKPIDPKTDENFGYSTTLNRKEYEIKMELEGDNLSLNTVNQALAAETTPKIMGHYNGYFIVGSDNNYYAVPSLFSSDITVSSGSLFDINGETVNYEVVGLRDKTNTNDIGTSNIKTDELYEDFTLALQDAYSGTELEGNVLYNSLISIEDWDTPKLESMAQSVLDGSAKSNIIVALGGGGGGGGEICKFDTGKYDVCVFQ